MKANAILAVQAKWFAPKLFFHYVRDFDRCKKEELFAFFGLENRISWNRVERDYERRNWTLAATETSRLNFAEKRTENKKVFSWSAESADCAYESYEFTDTFKMSVY